jgi:predicted negative regulator of RcsB-dependent stress response
MVLWSGLALASGADVDAALGRFTSARNQQETMLLIGALLAVGAFVGWTVYARRKK